jgi:hypothetical protein
VRVLHASASYDVLASIGIESSAFADFVRVTFKKDSFLLWQVEKATIAFALISFIVSSNSQSPW